MLVLHKLIIVLIVFTKLSTQQRCNCPNPLPASDNCFFCSSHDQQQENGQTLPQGPPGKKGPKGERGIKGSPGTIGKCTCDVSTTNLDQLRDELENKLEVLSYAVSLLKASSVLMRSCKDHKRGGASATGVYTVFDNERQPYEVFCEMEAGNAVPWRLDLGGDDS